MSTRTYLVLPWTHGSGSNWWFVGHRMCFTHDLRHLLCEQPATSPDPHSCGETEVNAISGHEFHPTQLADVGELRHSWIYFRIFTVPPTVVIPDSCRTLYLVVHDPKEEDEEGVQSMDDALRDCLNVSTLCTDLVTVRKMCPYVAPEEFDQVGGGIAHDTVMRITVYILSKI
jgi:hypothetical protein